MAPLLNSIGYDGWILPVLLLLPLVGAAVLWMHGATGTRREARVTGELPA